MTEVNDRYADWDPEDAEIARAMDASYVTCTLTCSCGRVHEVEYTPTGHDWHSGGIWCACGQKVTFGA